ncbi:hypothetical protein TESG_08222 [Trichophyton tonsurans CBS 112818]|uniref:Uncharacterized protein n=1 Tax=Trichophyton tonsurans (strain CBS 112818) TaxID=647933 RepID=F2SBI5_TRIT1|nr:hypothetical protein TESG_08222 [Trichophyton tonsurans CBS 112818]
MADLKARAKEQGTYKSRALFRAECNQIFTRASISSGDPSPVNHIELMYFQQTGRSYNPTRAPVATYAFARRHERVGSSARRRQLEEVGAGRSLELATQLDGEKLLKINGSAGVRYNDYLHSRKGINRERLSPNFQ